MAYTVPTMNRPQRSTGTRRIRKSAATIGGLADWNPDDYLSAEGLRFTGTGSAEVPIYQMPITGTWGTTGPWGGVEPPANRKSYAPVPVPETLPDWATASGFDDPQSLYETLANYEDPTVRDAVLNSITSYGTTKGAAGDILGQRLTSLEDSYNAWQNDPYMSTALTGLAAAAAPGAQVIGPAQRAAYNLNLAQGAARADALSRQSGAARGVGTSGEQTSRTAALQAMADAAGVSLGGQIESTNETARRQAATQLASVAQSGRQTDLAYENLLAGITAQQAELEQPIDWMDIASAEVAREQGAAELKQAGEISAEELEFGRDTLAESIREWDQQQANLEEESKMSTWDYVYQLLNLFPGALPMVLGL